MSSTTAHQVHGLEELLERCQRKIRVHAMLRGTAETICAAIAVLLVCLIVDYLLILPGVVRLAMLATGVVLLGFVLLTRLLRPVFSSAPDDELGAAMDLRFPELQESLATLISMENPTASVSELGSAVMRDRLTRYVEDQIGQIEPSKVIESRATVQRGGLAAVSILVLLIPMLFWPTGTRLLLQRFLMPFANLAAPTDLYFEVPSGSRVVATGSHVEILAIPHWHSGKSGSLPSDVVVELLSEKGVEERLPMTFDETQFEFAAGMPAVQNSFRYRVRGGRAVTSWFEITVAVPPAITQAEMIETPPVYTGRPVESFDGIVGDIHVFERSQVEMKLTFNKPVDEVEYVWKNWEPIESQSDANAAVMDAEFAAEDLARETAIAAEATKTPPLLSAEYSADRTSCVFRFEATGGGTFEFVARDALGLNNASEPSRRLIATSDKPPRIVVKGISDHLEVRPDDSLSVNCAVTDDIGIGLLELHYQKNADAVRIEPFAKLDRGAVSVEHEFSVAMKSLNVNVGDTVTFRVRTADERPIPGPQVVWKGPWTLRVTADAEPIGKKPLKEDDQKLVDALRKLEEELQKDTQKSHELKDQVWRKWEEEAQQQVRDLSEKEQTQGRELQKLAEQVAEHPLMAKQAEQLNDLANQIREDVPKKLTDAAAADRDPAARNLQESAQALSKAREELHKITDEIQKIAEVEQELAELNRLALDARQLARQSEKLDEDRREGKPEEGQTEEERQQELDAREAELQNEQRELNDGLKSLLQRRQELLQAAKEAQLDMAADLSKQAKQLAQQQQQLAEGVREEAQDAGRDAQELANQLQQARNEADQIGQQIQQQDQDIRRPEMQPLDEAIRDVRQGNLDSPEQKIDEFQQKLTEAAEAIRKPKAAAPGDPANPPDTAAAREQERKLSEENQKRAELGVRAEESVRKLEELESRLADMREDLAGQSAAGQPEQQSPQGQSENAGETPSQQNPNEADQAPGAEKNPPGHPQNSEAGSEPAQQKNSGSESGGEQARHPEPDEARESDAERAGRELMNQLDRMVESTEELSDAMKDDADTHPSARRHSELAAERAEEALRHARAGQFNRAAERMRQVAGESSNATEHLQQQGQEDRRTQMQQQRDDFNRMSDVFQQLNGNDAAQVAAQQETQQDVAESAQEMAAPLRELADRMNNEALGLQQQAKPLEDAASASEQGAQQGQQAGEQLDQAQMQQAGQSAQEASNQLNRAAQLAEQAASGHRDPNNILPSEVGESVNDAMHSLRKANELMQESAQERAAQMAAQKAEQNPNGESAPEGQPGQNSQDGQQAGDGQANGQPASEGQPTDGSQPGNQPSGAPSQQNGQTGQSGQQGQSGPPQRGSKGSEAARQMANAAKALQQAARQVVPGRFSPGQMNSESASEAAAIEGNPEMFDGRNPPGTKRRVGKRWDVLHDELEDKATDYVGDKIDPEYSEFIQRFRRGMARSGEESIDEKKAP
ncbi:MAG: hypothetical protein ACK58L_03965 [Planctomycetota bacterium]